MTSFVYFLFLFDFFEKLSFLGYKSVIKKSGCAFEEEAECLLWRVFFFLRLNCRFSTNSCILIPGVLSRFLFLWRIDQCVVLICFGTCRFVCCFEIDEN
jgi:hypothetical protein